VSMTPYLWHLDAAAGEALRKLNGLTVETEFVIRVAAPTPGLPA